MFKDERFEPKVEVVKPPLTPCQQHLLDAAEYIRTWGWYQGGLFLGHKACLLGAIYASAGYADLARARTPNISHAIEKERKAVERYLDRGNIASWNDEPGRTKEEVIAALEGAAHVYR